MTEKPPGSGTPPGNKPVQAGGSTKASGSSAAPQQNQKPQQPVPAKPAAGLRPAGGIPLSKGPVGIPTKQPSSRVTLSRGGPKVGVNPRSAAQEEEKRKQAEAMIPLEERAFTALGTKNFSEPPILTEFLQKIAPKVALAETSWTILEAFSNIDVTAERVSQALRGNPYYEYLFTKTIEGVSKREEMPSLEGAIVLLGMQNFRNLILALQISRSVTGFHVEFDKDGKIKIAPGELLKFAIKTEEQLLASGADYSDMGFTAGLLFDVLAQVAGAIAQDKKRTIAYIDNIYTHGLRTAAAGAQLAKFIPDFGLNRYLFSACLIHDLGKVAMAILNQDYFAFSEMAKKNEWPRAIRLFVERERFGIDHAAIGGLLCQHFRIFRPIEKVVRFHHAPFLLKSRNKNHHQLTSLICLATNIANNFKKIEKTDDPVLGLWKGVEISGFRLEAKAIVAAVSKINI